MESKVTHSKSKHIYSNISFHKQQVITATYISDTERHESNSTSDQNQDQFNHIPSDILTF